VHRDGAHTHGRAGRWFFVGVAGLAIGLSVMAFGPSLLNPRARLGPPTVWVALHGCFMAAWLITFLLQSWLAATGRVRWHRQAGIAGALLVPPIVISSYMVTVEMVRRGHDLSGDLARGPGGALDDTVFQFGNLIVFPALVGAALVLRRRPEVHKRLMTFAVMLALMGAPLAHLVGHLELPPLLLPAWGVLVVSGLAAHDVHVRRRVHPVTLWVGAGLVVLANVKAVVVAPSPTWQRLVAWLAQ
jgi:hypothetical protein